MLKVTIIENGKKVDKIVNIVQSTTEMNTLGKLGLEEVSLDKITEVEKVNKEVDGICCICQHHFNIGSHKRILQCGHFFHDSCIEQWLKTKIKCPLCAKDIA